MCGVHAWQSMTWMALHGDGMHSMHDEREVRRAAIRGVQVFHHVVLRFDGPDILLLGEP